MFATLLQRREQFLMPTNRNMGIYNFFRVYLSSAVMEKMLKDYNTNVALSWIHHVHLEGSVRSGPFSTPLASVSIHQGYHLPTIVCGRSGQATTPSRPLEPRRNEPCPPHPPRCLVISTGGITPSLWFSTTNVGRVRRRRRDEADGTVPMKNVKNCPVCQCL